MRERSPGRERARRTRCPRDRCRSTRHHGQPPRAATTPTRAPSAPADQRHGAARPIRAGRAALDSHRGRLRRHGAKRQLRAVFGRSRTSACRARRRRRAAGRQTPSSCWSTRPCTRRASAPSRTSGPTDGTPVIDVDRGGKITWHGPGQLVGYPIVRLPEPIDVVAYVRRLEGMLIEVLAEFGVRGSGSRAAAASGWSAPTARRRQDRRDRHPRRRGRHDARLRAQLQQLASRPTTAIVACGIADAGVTTISRELGRVVTPADVVPLVERHFPRFLEPSLATDAGGVRMSPAAPDRRVRPQAAAPGGAQRRDADRAQAGVDQDPRQDGPRVHRAARTS